MTDSTPTIDSVLSPPPTSNTVDHHDHEHKIVAQLCCNTMPAWHAIPLSHIHVRPIAGGMSNDLFFVSANYHEFSGCVLVRRYRSAALESDAAREEFLVQHLATCSLAPRVWACFVDFPRFGSGRLEEYLHDRRPMQVSEMKTHSLEIARVMARMHVTGIPCAKMLRVEKKERTYHFLRTWVKLAKRHSGTLSWDWETIDRYLEQQVYPRGEQWPVLCHNDMQELNFLIPANTDPAESAALNASECECVRLIDYEYACLGHPAFDMANHFLERCLDNLTMDVNRDAFPSASERTAFYRSYVQQWKAMGHELPHRMDGKSWDHEVHVLLGASHIQWACWGILKDQNVYADIRMTWFHDWLANADFMRDTVKLSPVR